MSCRQNRPDPDLRLLLFLLLLYYCYVFQSSDRIKPRRLFLWNTTSAIPGRTSGSQFPQLHFLSRYAADCIELRLASIFHVSVAAPAQTANHPSNQFPYPTCSYFLFNLFLLYEQTLCQDIKSLKKPAVILLLQSRGNKDCKNSRQSRSSYTPEPGRRVKPSDKKRPNGPASGKRGSISGCSWTRIASGFASSNRQHQRTLDLKTLNGFY